MLDVSGYDTSPWPAVRAWMARVASLPGAIDIDGKAEKGV
jgi:glutathione S-transferase